MLLSSSSSSSGGEAASFSSSLVVGTAGIFGRLVTDGFAACLRGGALVVIVVRRCLLSPDVSDPLLVCRLRDDMVSQLLVESLVTSAVVVLSNLSLLFELSNPMYPWLCTCSTYLCMVLFLSCNPTYLVF